jgi:hypothetical protein
MCFEGSQHFHGHGPGSLTKAHKGPVGAQHLIGLYLGFCFFPDVRVLLSIAIPSGLVKVWVKREKGAPLAKQGRVSNTSQVQKWVVFPDHLSKGKFGMLYS